MGSFVMVHDHPPCSENIELAPSSQGSDAHLMSLLAQKGSPELWLTGPTGSKNLIGSSFEFYFEWASPFKNTHCELLTRWIPEIDPTDFIPSGASAYLE